MTDSTRSSFTTERIVALVGKPNVGKSRLFNRLAGRRVAIVHDQPGVTRDVKSIEVDNDYTLLDTGGIGLEADMTQKQLVEAAEEQVFVAMATATVICLVVDGREGCGVLDLTILEKLRSFGKEPILVVNKLDTAEMEDRIAEFDEMGLATVLPVSAEHARGIEDLQAVIAERLGPKPETPDEAHGEHRIKICFAGRPNVGKSSLCNRLLNAEKIVVSEVPGTTRDSTEHKLDYAVSQKQTWPFQLIDTAGVRKRGRMNSSVEYFSSLRSHEAIYQADVVFLVIDAMEGVGKQDKAICGEIVKAGKPIAVVVNKWDYALELFDSETLPGYESESDFRKKFATEALKELFFLPHSPVLFVSAKSGFSVDTILSTSRELYQRSGQKLPTPRINRLVKELMTRREPKLVKGRRFKVYYALQTGIHPIRLRFFCNQVTKLEDSYRRYIENAFISTFNLQGCPLRLELTGKEQSVRNPKKTHRIED